MSAARASEVSGPVATMVTGSSGIRSTSPRRTATPGRAATASVTRRANSSRSTASALPAGTFTSSATRMVSDPMRRISSFSRPAAWSRALPRRLLEQTSSARSPVWWTGVLFTGRISCRSTPIPWRDSCHAASTPARPPPTIVTRAGVTPSGRALVMARLVPAEDDLAFLLGLLLQPVAPAAIGARLGDGAVVGGELAVGVPLAAVEGAAPPALPLHHLALAAVGTQEADLAGLLLLYVLARRVVAARDEGTKAAAAPGQVLAALRALLVDGLQGLDLQLVAFAADQPLRGLAVRVAPAGQEGTEAALLQHHEPVGRIQGTDLRGHVGVQLGLAAVLARQLARVLALRIGGAGQELAV